MINKLSMEILNCTEIKNFQDNWNLIKYVTSVVDTPEARKIIIHILDIWENINEESKSIWLDLIERVGFYPYYIEKIKGNKRYEQSVQMQMRTAFFKSDYIEGVYFHEKQKEIELALSQNKNIAVSAPTSFGKSLLIEEMVARSQYNNILIIQPTLALIEETRRKMVKYKQYNIIVNTRQNIKDKNIFILTAERVLEFKNMPVIDFFIIDEFYKISNKRNDGRIDALNVALYKIMNMNPQSMFLTPSVDALSTKFQKKYNIEFYKTDYTLVNTNIIEVRNEKGDVYKAEKRKIKLFDLLKAQKSQSIVYVKSSNEAYKLANEYLDYISDNSLNVINENLYIYEWIDENISEHWQLKKLLKYGIGTHNGTLPRHIVTSEIDLFNEGVIKVLFATTSLIEGVNTAAKNMFIYSQTKGNKKIDFFDYANIRGRAGRMGEYFTGNVYLFNDVIDRKEFKIDVPIVDQKEITDEIIINIPENEVVDQKRFSNLTKDLNDDILMIIQNNLINVNGQKKLYSYMLENYLELEYLKWRTIPTYEQLQKTLFLGYKYLKNNNNTKIINYYSANALKLVKKPLKSVIDDQQDYLLKNDAKDPVNEGIDKILKFIRQQANFEIPKLLTVIETIQKYVFVAKGIENYGDYTLFISKLENGNVDERFQFLIDYGVPKSAVLKMKDCIPNELKEDTEILNYINNNYNLFINKLITYERKLVEKAIK